MPNMSDDYHVKFLPLDFLKE